MPFEEVITLGAGHSILLGNLPSSVQLSNFSDVYSKSKDLESFDSFGLFGGDINYHTYYPEVSPEEFKPKDEEFIEPVFRMLSAGIVARNWSPTDFSREGVLKNSMNLLIGQTVNCDHETNIGNAIGSVKEVYWQEAYTVNKNGKNITVPAGINAKLRIDGKANPRIARGIMMDPPSIHSNSVTVRFLWEKSHPEMEDRDFWYKLGEVDKNGKLVCKVATKILGYYETSLVSHGADPFAQKVDKDGKIINPVYANQANQSYSDKKPPQRKYFFTDYKDLPKAEVLHNTMVFNNDIYDTNPNKDNMNKELQEFIESLFGDNLLSLSDGKSKTQDEVISCIKSLVSSKASFEAEVKTLKEDKSKLETEVSTLKADIEKNKSLVTIGTEHLSEVRTQVTNDYKKLMDKDADESMLTLIANADLNTLVSLGKSYKVQLEQKFPMTCEECGSHKVSRASSVTSNSEDDGKEKSTKDKKDNQSLVEDIRKRSRKSKSNDKED